MTDTRIAIIGADIRAPGAPDLESFLAHILNGTEALQDVDADDVPDAITRRPVLADVDQFDPSHFGLSMADAVKLDPQHRHFLMLCRSMLHKAAVDPAQLPNIGVVASCDENQYFRNVLSPAMGAGSAAAFADYVSSDKDFVATRVSYLLGLTGPAYTVQTACSSSLVAVHQAMMSLRMGECDACIAGGVSIQFPHGQAVQHIPDMIYSRDGSCRPFDAQADGTNLGSGAAAVLLCRYEDAVARGDRILATLNGSAINNDGNRKMSYTAPSPTGQQRAIESALQAAGGGADNVAFVETHGTATRLGDPIEFRALSKAFATHNAPADHTALTGLKANFGHLSCAAGVAGVIKAALCLDQRIVPRMTNFETPSPMLRLSGSPFRILTQNEAMGRGAQRALVSSFGIGGTNAVVVLESAPLAQMQAPAGLSYTLLSDEAAAPLARNIAALAAREPDAPGAHSWASDRLRTVGPYRGFVLSTPAGQVTSATADAPGVGQSNVCFVYPGQGAFPASLMAELYQHNARFRQHFDTAVAAFDADWQARLQAELTAQPKHPSQPLQFVSQVALTGLLADHGITPDGALGHSLGEFAAMVATGAMPLAKAAALVAARDAAMQNAPRGRMLVLRDAQPEDIATAIAAGCAMAAINGGGQVTLSGSEAEVKAAQARIDQSSTGTATRILDTDVGFHREAMRDCLAPLVEAAKGQFLAASPRFFSTLTGKAPERQTALGPYLVSQAVQPVMFSTAVETALHGGATHFIEIGRSMLSAWAAKQGAQVISLLDFVQGDASFSLGAGLGKLWVSGLDVDLPTSAAAPGKLLPNYSFDPVTCWPEPSAAPAPVQPQAATPDAPPKPQPGKPVASDTLAEVFKRHLNVAEVNADADFIKLGVHSMMAIGLCADIKRATGAPIEMTTFMELGTLRRLEDWINARESA